MFCKVKGYEEFGIGKVIEEGIDEYEIAFFISPSSHLKKCTIKKNLYIPVKKLEKRQRVFYNYEGDKWIVGYVLDSLPESIFVKFPNKSNKYINIDDNLFVRSNLKIKDPTEFLANKVNETPFFAFNRHCFMKEYIKQRGLSNGMSAYISSNIYLEEHQYNVISQVLSDPFQRYLLADEVGLGKTIETCVLIRQHLIDNPNRKILLIIPPNLKRQWEEELEKRFHITSDYIKFVTYNEINSLSENTEYSMLVIDEAHNIVKNVTFNYQTETYKIIQNLSKKIESLLILSATPALGNEESFLAMLNILDPVLYPLDSLDRFKKKIKQRQNIAEIVSLLNPEDMYFLPDKINELKKIFSDDVQLIELSDKLLDILNLFPEEDDEELKHSINLLKAHISETYKLDRRILRNRRKRYNDLIAERRGCEEIYYQNDSLYFLIESIDDWRLNFLSELNNNNLEPELLIKTFSNIFYLFIDALFTNPKKINDYIEIRLGANKSIKENYNVLKNIPLLENEEELLNNIKRNIENFNLDLYLDSKIEVLVDRIRLKNLKNPLVIFATDKSICEYLYDKLENYFPNSISLSSNLESYDLFINLNNKKILICDKNSEEGLNFQEKTTCVFNFDLPFSPNRIEQRIGRVDRYGARGYTNSYILINENNQYEFEWANLLNLGFKVFNNSIASLQYLIEEELEELKKNLLLEGYEILQDVKRIEEKVLNEIKKIDISDSLNEMLSTNNEDIFDNLRNEDEETIKNHFSRLIQRSYLFQIDNENNNIFRYKYLYEQFKNNTLITLNDFINSFKNLIEIRQNGQLSTYKLSYIRSNQNSKNNVRLIRYGSNLVESFYRYVQRDDRGISFAMWRFSPNYLPIYDKVDIFLKFNFIIETDLSYVTSYSKNLKSKDIKISTNNLKRLGDEVLRPFFKTIWLDVDGNIVSNEIIENHLRYGYSKEKRDNEIYDKNINQDIWDALATLNIDALDNWSNLCVDLRKIAERKLLETDEIRNINRTINLAKEKDSQVFIQKKARINHLQAEDFLLEEERLEIDKKIRESLYDGCLNPKIKLDSIGAIFLSNKELSIN